MSESKEVLGSGRTQERPSRAPSHDSLTKFTPGPWRTDKAPFLGEAYEVRTPGACIATVGNLGATSDHAPTAKRWKAENKANAHLMAAAPDMYEALQQMAARLRRDADVYRKGGDPGVWNVMTRVAEMADAALAKARGESAPSEGRLSSISSREAQAEPERPEHKACTSPAVEEVAELVARLKHHGTCGALHDTREGVDFRLAADLLTRLASEKARLEGELAKAREWSPSDEDDEWTPAIRAAHPTELKTPEAWRAWNAALEMVGKRRSKYALVDLASWLLARAERAEAERDAATKRAEEAETELEKIQLYLEGRE